MNLTLMAYLGDNCIVFENFRYSIPSGLSTADLMALDSQ
jgi:alpha-glucosidase (family GH31 glycosyl hydrolase)